MALGVALPRGDHLHQLCLTLLHHALQLGVHLPALLQLLLSARLQEERVRTERRLRANPCCYYIIFYFHHDFCRQAGCFPDKFSCNQNGKLFFCPWQQLLNSQSWWNKERWMKEAKKAKRKSDRNHGKTRATRRHSLSGKSSCFPFVEDLRGFKADIKLEFFLLYQQVQNL